MFGAKKEIEEIPALSGYNSDIISEIKKCLTNQKPSLTQSVNWNKIRSISIDQITLNKTSDDVAIVLPNSISSKYQKSWYKSLGRWIRQDFRKNQNHDKYNFLIWTVDDTKIDKDSIIKVAFFRYIEEDDLKEDETLDELVKNGVISFSYKIRKEVYYCQVLKVFEHDERIDNEYQLAIKNLISKDNDDYKFIEVKPIHPTYDENGNEEKMFIVSYQSNDNSGDEEQNETVEDEINELSKTEPQEETFINQEMLF